MDSPPRVLVAAPDHAPVVAALVAELLEEVRRATEAPPFEADRAEMARQARALIQSQTSRFLLAYRGDAPLGVMTLSVCHTLYAGGAMGVIAEFYVRPEARGQGLGTLLLEQAGRLALAMGWKRLEVTTPPLPQFEGSLRFYERHGFVPTGGRKLKRLSPG